jgi:hypothetical protein
MGNGFTFPLESLLFWALTKACCSDDEVVSIYGDDIICPTHRVPLIHRVLTACGFSLNLEKSYYTGEFRESCGTDYYRGIDIRPYYQKKLVSGETLFTLHNFYKRNHRDDMASRVLNCIPEDMRIYGPDGYGDGHLIGDWTPLPHKREIGYAGFLFETYKRKSRIDRRPSVDGDAVLPAYCVYLGGNTSEEKSASDRFFRGHGPIVDSPEHVNVFPGSSGYKRVSIYTFTNS